jgi:molybdenum cofactor cytidylyltransferase
MKIKVTAIILAAGESRRMGQPKLLLAWGGRTVLGAVIESIKGAGIEDILVVTGGAREQVESICARYAVRTVHNDKYVNGEMLSSIQCGLSAINSSLPSLRDTSPREASCKDKSFRFLGGREGALICLGDQPQVQKETVKQIITAFSKTHRPLVIPSFQNRRGHPWLVDRSLWPQLVSLTPGQSPRDFLSAHEKGIFYVPAKNDSILRDLDTPEEYEQQKP